MNTYWDLESKERAALTTDDVENFLVLELMEKGVGQPTPRDLQKVPAEPRITGKKKTLFSISFKGEYGSGERLSLYFESKIAAETFIACKLFRVDYDYRTGSNYSYHRRVENIGIVEEKFFNKEDLLAVSNTLVNIKQAEDENRKLTRDFEEAVDKCNKVTEDVWKDYQNQLDIKRCHTVIRDVFSEYVATCNGDTEIAGNFLLKRYDKEAITNAVEYLGTEWHDEGVPHLPHNLLSSPVEVESTT